MDDSDFDRFGGWTGWKFNATGYFRVEKADRWWIVTPEGNAFLSFGINHLNPEFWLQEYNSAAWKSNLDLEDLHDDRFIPALKAWFLETCRRYRFNTVGVHSDLSVANYEQPSLPYVLPIEFVDIPHHRADVIDDDFVDVFSKEFVVHCERMAEKFASPEDPFLLGYALTDCPLLTEEDCRERPDTIGGAPRDSRIGWPRRLRNLGADAAGKQAYVDSVRGIYRGQIDDFNATYGTAFDSFDALLTTQNWRPETDLSNGYETRDNVEFLKVVVARYYQTTRDALRRFDPNHMFFGDKLNGNTDSLDTVLPITSQFTDVVFLQMYGRYDVQSKGMDRWSRLVDKPFINGDAAFTMTTDIMPRPYGPVADNITQRTQWTEEFFRNAFSRPEFVGWHYCGLIDAPNLILRKADRQHSGLLDHNGEPYPGLQDALANCADRMYEIASKVWS